jgi:oxygen-independent coproporphyrinogen III oxidase
VAAPASRALTSKVRERLARMGLDRGFGPVKRAVKAFESSHIIVAYPPRQAMGPVSAGDIGAGGRDLALYLHVPFCLNKCAFCHYISDDGSDESGRWRYVDFLKREIGLVSEAFGLAGKRVRSIHVGGGTPTVLRTASILDVLREVGDRFDVASDAEVTLESCPRSLIRGISDDGLARVLDAGVNRLSMGVQTFDDRVLRIAGREHTGAEALKAYGLAKEAGFGNANLDMMIGLPGQDDNTLRADLKRLEGLMPESVTLYHLRLKSTVPLYDMFLRDEGFFPGEDASLMMDVTFREYMGCLGYGEDPVNWFNRSPGYRYRHQMDKWRDEADLVAFGPSAYSFMNGVQYYNHSGLADYYGAIEAGRPPISCGARLGGEELRRRHVIFAIKTRDGVVKADYEGRFGSRLEDDFPSEVAALAGNGLAQDGPDSLELTEKGMLFADEVSRMFYSRRVDGLLGR